MKKKQYVIGLIILSVIIISLIVFLIFSGKNIVSTSLDKEMEVVPNIDLVDNKVLIYDGNDEYHFKFENNKLIYEKYLGNQNDNYSIEIKDDLYYIVNNNTKKESVPFIDYTPIIINDKTQYYILKTYDEYIILNTTSDKYIYLDSEIFDFYNIYNMYNKLTSDKYLIVMNSDYKQGVIDYNGKKIIDFKYDSISIEDDKFIVKQDSKMGVIDKNNNKLIEIKYDRLSPYEDKYLAIFEGKYGVIDSKGKILLNHEYTNARVADEHIALEKEGKIAIFTDKLVLEPTIQLSDRTKLSTYTFNNKIHILTNDKTYIINNGKIEKTLDTKLYTILIEEKEGKYSNKYTYSKETNGLNTKFEIYDVNYNKYYTYEINEQEDKNKYTLMTSVSTKNDKYYNINVELMPKNDEDDPIQKIYQYDFDNKKEVTSSDLEKISLENGITYTIDKDNNLTIYNEDKIIGEYKDILYFVENYYFIDKNGIVYKLNFKYE